VKLGFKEKRKENGIERKVHIDNKWWKIMTIYSKEMKTTRRRVEDAMKENWEDRILLGGDFNGRTGERGARNWEQDRGDGKRKSKDKVENPEGKRNGSKKMDGRYLTETNKWTKNGNGPI
jgi:hypothetical protein